MPRNRAKAPCAVPGCRAWSLRDGPYCRVHRDRLLGRSAGGASPGNLNALQTGGGAHPIDADRLDRLAAEIVADPAALPWRIAGLLADLHARTPDPYRVLVALRVLLPDLIAALSRRLLDAELDALLRPLSPAGRSVSRARLDGILSCAPPKHRLRMLRRARSARRKTAPGTGVKPC